MTNSLTRSPEEARAIRQRDVELDRHNPVYGSYYKLMNDAEVQRYIERGIKPADMDDRWQRYNEENDRNRGSSR
jgi:hypothetical protein